MVLRWQGLVVAHGRQKPDNLRWIWQRTIIWVLMTDFDTRRSMIHGVIRLVDRCLGNQRALWTLCGLVISTSIVEAQVGASTPDPPSVQAVKIEGGIRVDGRFDEEAWQKAVVLDRFIQREPQEGSPSSERTEVRILFDQHNLYIGFRCWDSEVGKIVANEMRRDADLMHNDCVEIYLDTYHDHRNAFYFCTNPLGAQRDGIITADVSDEEQNWDWNGVWENACLIDSSGWTAELAIPFQTLRFHEGSDLVWGINLARFIPRKREEAFWSPILRDYGWWGKYRLSSYGHLQGLRQMQQPGDLELKPFALAGLQRDFEEALPYESKLNIGLDAKYHLTSNLTADISLKTDFAQVEADQEQVNLTRFELLFPEKRDFFLEGAAMFRFGERMFSPFTPPSVLFFSRRIGLSEDNELVPLLGGVKVTGKAGSFNVGLLNMVADRTSYVNEDDEFVSIPRANFSVVRLRKDILTNSYVGIIGLNKESLDDGSYNRNIGADATIYLTAYAQTSGFVAKTLSPGKNGNDLAAYGDFFYNDDFWTLYLAQNTIQDNFNPEMGFFPRTGIRTTQINFGISPRPKMFNIRQIALFEDFSYITNQHGELVSRLNYIGFYSLFESGATLLALFNQEYELLTEDFEIHDGLNILPGVYRFNNVMSQFDSDKSKPLSGMLAVNIGDFYDGSIVGFGLGANIKLGSRLTLYLQSSRNDVKLSNGSFTTTLIATRILYTFSPKLFAKAFVQWNSDKNIVVANFLVNFIHTPGSDLFLVYNEEVATGGRATTNNRTLMLKFTYLFHL